MKVHFGAFRAFWESQFMRRPIILNHHMLSTLSDSREKLISRNRLSIILFNFNSREEIFCWRLQTIHSKVLLFWPCDISHSRSVPGCKVFWLSFQLEYTVLLYGDFLGNLIPSGMGLCSASWKWMPFLLKNVLYSRTGLSSVLSSIRSNRHLDCLTATVTLKFIELLIR
jgi:hypothetical protein